MSKSTRATLALTPAAESALRVLAYDYDPDVNRIGLAAAEAIESTRRAC